MRQENTIAQANLSLGAAVSDSILGQAQAIHRPRQRRGAAGFTLAELLVSFGVLALLVCLATQLLNSTAAITTLGHKQMDVDSQARQLLDRMAVDFAQLVKRSDLDLFSKGTTTPNSGGGSMPGNDQIAFYSGVPGYYPPAGSQSPVSLVAYRVNSSSASSSYNKIERLGKGLVWNGVSPIDTPVVFMPLTISGTWPVATSTSASDAAYEAIGPQVFRFEYCYLLVGGDLSVTPPSNISGLAGFIVDIAAIDLKSKVLLTNAQIATFATPGNANFLADYSSNMTPGQLRNQWQNTVYGVTSLPRPALSGVRLYERCFYLSPPTP